MKTTNITVRGSTLITSKKTGKVFTVLHFTYYDCSDNTVGENVGSLWLEGEQNFELHEKLEAVLGYDRHGNYGVVDII